MLGAGVRVLVIGAGFAGLAAARTLGDWGAAVEIIERQPDPPGDGTGIYLLGYAVRALDTLGVGDQVAERAIHIRRQRTEVPRSKFPSDTFARPNPLATFTADWRGLIVRSNGSGGAVNGHQLA